MRLELVQGYERIFDKERNADFIKNRLEESEADLIIFPELFLTGYVINERAFELAEKKSSQLIREIAESAEKNKKATIFGAVEEDEEVKGLYYNSAFVIDEKGAVDTYRKISLPNFGPFNEKRFFCEGGERKTFSLKGAKVCVLICYDLFFPQLCSPCDLLVYISASPYTSRSSFEKLFPARALESTSYLAYVNLAGREESTMFWGGSRALDPHGDEILRMKYFESEIAQADVDIGSLSQIRTRRPVIRDAKMGIVEKNIKKGLFQVGSLDRK
ncbi:MAG: carbon-nitrogen hydrolase family protein [Candidatus Thermoplasmatota archaeon]|nr:carbon-nitrogen hydrolase family protein [Candidatus Thermoplasmatota archaeon]